MSDVEALELDFTKPHRQRIHRIGIELEGGWRKLPEDAAIIRDGSVVFETPKAGIEEAALYHRIMGGTGPAFTTSEERYAAEARYHLLAQERKKQVPPKIGELPSTPKEMDAWIPWIRKYYPSDVNATCGMHVHFSFRTALIYQRVMDPALTETTVKYITQWAERNLPSTHCIWDRLAGKSVYCQKLYYGDLQARRTNKDHEHHAVGCRYTMWNYSYLRHGTAECRLLPMMPNVDLAISAIEELIKITNAFIIAVGKKEDTIINQVLVEDPIYREELHERV